MQNEPNPPTSPAILAKALEYRYPDGRWALRGINLSIGKGETVALVGPNGAGKSTFLLHLNGLLPGRARAGSLLGHSHDSGNATRRPSNEPSLWIGGLAVIEKNGPEIRRRVGLLFQDPDDQLFSNSVIEDVAFGPLNLGMSRREARALAMECLERVSLADRADRSPRHLSFGERKRVCLAGLLACKPSVLVLDEPSANLDPRSRRRLMELIQGLDATTLIATHDLEMTLELCERTILLDEGQVVADGPTLAILGDDRLLDAHGLELPWSLKPRS